MPSGTRHTKARKALKAAFRTRQGVCHALVAEAVKRRNQGLAGNAGDAFRSLFAKAGFAVPEQGVVLLNQADENGVRHRCHVWVCGRSSLTWLRVLWCHRRSGT